LSAASNGFIELVAKHYQFAVFVISIFAVAMGVSRWLGKTLWLNRENLHRKKLGLPTASLFASGGSSEQSFTYTALLQGGLVGLGILGIVLSYVVLMLAFFYFIGDVDGWPRALKGTVGLMIYPVGMLGFIVLIAIVFCKGSNSLFHSIAMFVFVVLCVVAGLSPVGQGKSMDASVALTIQSMALAILSLFFSYLVGMGEGIKKADPSLNYPLVNFVLVQGDNLDKALLYERTDSDYRLIAQDGSNRIVPAVNVREIRMLESPRA